jgi:hypothetical protein
MRRLQAAATATPRRRKDGAKMHGSICFEVDCDRTPPVVAAMSRHDCNGLRTYNLIATKVSRRHPLILPPLCAGQTDRHSDLFDGVRAEIGITGCLILTIWLVIVTLQRPVYAQRHAVLHPEANRRVAKRTREKSGSCITSAAALIRSALATRTVSASLRRSDLAALFAMSTSSATYCHDSRIARQRRATASSGSCSGSVSTSLMGWSLPQSVGMQFYGLRRVARNAVRISGAVRGSG